MVNEAIKRLISENAIEERGGSEILYHFTSIEAIKSILQNNGANGGYFSMSRPNTVDDSILGREKSGKGKFTHYMSLTRSPNANWGYVKALDRSAFGRSDDSINVSPNNPKNVGSARITFDGRKLSAGRIIKPIDFFGPYTDEKGEKYDSNTQTTSGKWAGSDPTKKSMIKQGEDRLFGFTYEFDGILNYVTRIDIFASSNASKSQASEILELSKGTPVEGKIHVYDSFRAYNRPDFERIKSAATKKGLSQSEWRPEINKSIEGFTYTRKNKRVALIENAKLTNIAVFVWAVLFVETYGGKIRRRLSENSKIDSLKFNGIFSNEAVKRVIGEIVKPVREEKFREEISNLVFNRYKELSNFDIAKYCFSANPKFEEMSGIAQVLVNSIYDIARKKFNFKSYKTLLTAASNKMKEMWSGDADVEAGKKYKDEKIKRNQEQQKNKRLGIEKTKPSPKPRPEPKVAAHRGRRGRDVVIPTYTVKFPEIGKVTITNVTDTRDALDKFSKTVPPEILNRKKASIQVRISQLKKALSEPTLFSQGDIEEMVNECLRRLGEQL